MGLIDVLNGMQNGPQGPQGSQTAAAGSKGMSPMTMAILGLLAYKAVKSFTAQAKTEPTKPGGNAASSTNTGAGGVLQSGLGTLLAGGTAGSVLSGGLTDLLKQFEQSGLGDVAKSWVETGPNKSISPGEMAKALGSEKIDTLVAHSGLPRQELLAGLSQYLPGVIDRLTPNDRPPSEKEMARAI